MLRPCCYLEAAPTDPYDDAPLSSLKEPLKIVYLASVLTFFVLPTTTYRTAPNTQFPTFKKRTHLTVNSFCLYLITRKTIFTSPINSLFACLFSQKIIFSEKMLRKKEFVEQIGFVRHSTDSSFAK